MNLIINLISIQNLKNETVHRSLCSLIARHRHRNINMRVKLNSFMESAAEDKFGTTVFDLFTINYFHYVIVSRILNCYSFNLQFSFQTLAEMCCHFMLL